MQIDKTREIVIESGGSRYIQKRDALLRFVAVALLVAFSSLQASAQFADYNAKSEENKLQGKRVRFTGVPILTYNNSFGAGFGALPMALYRFNKNDTISPPSATTLITFVTTNKTWGVGSASRWFVHNDQYRFMLAYFYASVNFQTYNETIHPGGIFIDFNTGGNYLFIEAQRETFKKLYVGMNFLFTRVSTVFDLDTLRGNQLTNYNALGSVLSYDTRDNQFTPSKGIFTTFRPLFYRSWVGSARSYEDFRFDINHYHSFRRNPHHLFASRIAAAISSGNVPFEAENVLGRDDIRGYTQGKYRDKQNYTMQVEWRWNFWKRLGSVAFFGVGFVTDEISNLAKNGVLPGGGIGLRYLAIESERLTLGVDAAIGKDDWGIYFRIGEAF